jgi:hypothetical protein
VSNVVLSESLRVQPIFMSKTNLTFSSLERPSLSSRESQEMATTLKSTCTSSTKLLLGKEDG